MSSISGCDCDPPVCVESADWSAHFSTVHADFIDTHSASPSNTFSYDADWHWRACRFCDEASHRTGKTAHTFNANGKCITCGYQAGTSVYITQQPHSVTAKSSFEEADEDDEWSVYRNHVRFSIKAKGSNLTYQWYTASKSDLSYFQSQAIAIHDSEGVISGATAATLEYYVPQDDCDDNYIRYFRCKVSDGSSIVWSEPASLTCAHNYTIYDSSKQPTDEGHYMHCHGLGCEATKLVKHSFSPWVWTDENHTQRTQTCKVCGYVKEYQSHDHYECACDSFYDTALFTEDWSESGKLGYEGCLGVRHDIYGNRWEINNKTHTMWCYEGGCADNPTKVTDVHHFGPWQGGDNPPRYDGDTAQLWRQCEDCMYTQYGNDINNSKHAWTFGWHPVNSVNCKVLDSYVQTGDAIRAQADKIPDKTFVKWHVDAYAYSNGEYITGSGTDYNLPADNFYLVVPASLTGGGLITVSAIYQDGCAHKKTETVGVLEATCGHSGYTGDLVCADCGKVITEGEETMPGPHGAAVEVLKDVCRTDANGEILINPKTGEPYYLAREYHEPTCWVAGNYPDKVCSICGTVLERGKRIPTSKAHVYDEHLFPCTQSRDYTSFGICYYCEHWKDMPGVYEHENTDVFNASEPTCLTAGYTGDTVCTDCGIIVERGETIEPLGHNWHIESVSVQATSTKTGIAQGVCTRCGVRKSITVPKKQPAPKLSSYSGKLRVVVTADSDAGSYLIMYCKTADFSNYYTKKTTLTQVDLSEPKVGETWYVKVMALPKNDDGEHGVWSAVSNLKLTTKQLTEENVTLDKEAYPYDGNTPRPLVTVKYGDTVLKEYTDYSIDYGYNFKPCHGYLTVTGKGDYSGSVNIVFPIYAVAPENVSAAIGDTAKITLNFSQTDEYTYQWQTYNETTQKWVTSGLEGSQTPELIVPVTASRIGKQYRCVVTKNNHTSTSNVSTLRLMPTITEHPHSVTNVLGYTAKFSVTAEGEGLTYQWQYNAGDGWKSSGGTGAKTASLSIPITTGRNGNRYRCLIKDAYGATIYSCAVTLKAKTNITAQPQSVSAPIGEAAKFTVTASGVGLTYQWQYNKGEGWKNSNGTGSKTDTLTINTAAGYNGYQYRCIINNTNNQSQTSAAATLKVKTTITGQPASLTKAIGEAAKFTVTATGVGLTYQWQYNKGDGWTNSNAAGSKTNALTINTAAGYNGYKYRCVITDANSAKTYSNAATLNVKLAVTGQPANVTEAVGTAAKFTVTAVGTGLTYQWQYNKGDGWANSNATGSKTATLTINTAAGYNNYQYRCVITDVNGVQTVSDAAKLTVKTVITTQPNGINTAVGTTAKFTVAATGAGLKYQWQYNSGDGWKNSGATGATTATLSINAKTAYNCWKYRCVITDANGTTTTSSVATLKIKTAITAQPASVSAAVGNTAKFTVTATGVGLTYQWQYNKGDGWTNSGATGATTAALSINAKVGYNGYQYRCVITDGNGKTTTSEAATLTLKPAITGQPASETAAFGSTAQFTVTATGVSLKYQWQYNSGSGWKNSNGTGATTATLTINAKSTYNNWQYRCVITDGNGAKTYSDAAQLTVK